MSKNIILPAIRDHSGAPLIGQKFEWREHKPSWRRWGNDGAAFLKVEGHKQAGWVQLSAEEGYTEKDRWIGKKVHLCLDRPQAEALRDLLNAILGGSSREARTLLGYVHLGRPLSEQPVVKRVDV